MLYICCLLGKVTLGRGEGLEFGFCMRSFFGGFSVEVFSW